MNTRTDMSESPRAPVERGPAWRAAEAAGNDMSLIELSLAKTPWERMQEHDRALAQIEMLRAASVRPHD
jgi:hypothetical protein